MHPYAYDSFTGGPWGSDWRSASVFSRSGNLASCGTGISAGGDDGQHLGLFAMGLFVVYAAQRGVAHLTPLIMTGLLGGFTTFSAFSLEAVTLFERGSMGQALGYVTLSLVLSIGGLILGLMIARGIWA